MEPAFSQAPARNTIAATPEWIFTMVTSWCKRLASEELSGWQSSDRSLREDLSSALARNTLLRAPFSKGGARSARRRPQPDDLIWLISVSAPRRAPVRRLTQGLRWATHEALGATLVRGNP